LIYIYTGMFKRVVLSILTAAAAALPADPGLYEPALKMKSFPLSFKNVIGVDYLETSLSHPEGFTQTGPNTVEQGGKKYRCLGPIDFKDGGLTAQVTRLLALSLKLCGLFPDVLLVPGELASPSLDRASPDFKSMKKGDEPQVVIYAKLKQLNGYEEDAGFFKNREFIGCAALRNIEIILVETGKTLWEGEVSGRVTFNKKDRPNASRFLAAQEALQVTLNDLAEKLYAAAPKPKPAPPAPPLALSPFEGPIPAAAPAPAPLPPAPPAPLVSAPLATPKPAPAPSVSAPPPAAASNPGDWPDAAPAPAPRPMVQAPPPAPPAAPVTAAPSPPPPLTPSAPAPVAMAQTPPSPPPPPPVAQTPPPPASAAPELPAMRPEELDQRIALAMSANRPIDLVLKNGSKYSGKIIKAGPAYIKVDMGTSAMTIFKSMIATAK
jgi:hypothetical protein